MKYFFLAIIPMLQFALPFAGAFAATICLHRMAQDNEFIAMAVSGQSYLRLLAPMALFGIVLTIIVAILSQTIIPTTIGRMAKAMTADLPKVLTNSIKHHTPFVQGNLVIWAEDIYLDQSNKDERMALDHVAVARVGKNGRAKMYFTAAIAVVDVQRIDNQTSLLVKTRDTTQWTRGDDGSGILRGAKEGHLTQAIDLPSLTNQRLSALTLTELLHLLEHPTEYHFVQKAVNSLKLAIIRDEFLSELRERAQKEGSLTCVATSDDRQFIITSSGLNGTSFVPPISVHMIRDTGEESDLNPKRAALLIDYADSGVIESITLRMQDVTVGVGKIGENQRGELVVPSLIVKHVKPPTLDENLTTETLLQIADASKINGVKSLAANLRLHIAALDNHVFGRIGQRWAVSFLPVLAILLGSLLAIRHSNVMPLGVYAKVFIPTVVSLLLIFSGGQMIRDANEIGGFSVMWIGNISLLGLILFNWWRLRVT